MNFIYLHENEEKKHQKSIKKIIELITRQKSRQKLDRNQ